MIFRRLLASLISTALLSVGIGELPSVTPAVAATDAGPPPVAGLPAATRELINVPGAPEPHTPRSLNRALAFRYYLPGAPSPSIVLVLTPGMASGANTLDPLAQALLAAYGPGLEVWVITPRSALLEDRRGIEAALAHQDPDLALAYYYGHLAIDGRTFHQLTAMEVPYAAYWGLDVHLRDIRAIVRQAHARYPGALVVLGGHSVGGILAALYAGYDFGRIPGSDLPPSPGAAGDIGAWDLAGLLLLDGVPLKLELGVTPDRYLHGFWFPILGRIPGVENLTAMNPGARAGPFMPVDRFGQALESILLDVISVYAYLRPQAASHFPFYPRRGLAITNEALAAAVLSDQMQPDLWIRASIAAPLGIFRHIPDPTGINPGGLLDLASGQPAPGEQLIRLPSDDRQPGEGKFRALLAAILRPGADFTQWYFPWRLPLDIGLVSDDLDASDPFSGQYMSLTHVRDTTLPIFIIGAGRGVIRSPQATEFYLSHISTAPSKVAVRILDGYAHLDIGLAVPNPAVPLVLDWLKALIRQGE
jgi:hypothetical protein